MGSTVWLSPYRRRCSVKVVGRQHWPLYARHAQGSYGIIYIAPASAQLLLNRKLKRRFDFGYITHTETATLTRMPGTYATRQRGICNDAL